MAGRAVPNSSGGYRPVDPSPRFEAKYQQWDQTRQALEAQGHPAALPAPTGCHALAWGSVGCCVKIGRNKNLFPCFVLLKTCVFECLKTFKHL